MEDAAFEKEESSFLSAARKGDHMTKEKTEANNRVKSKSGYLIKQRFFLKYVILRKLQEKGPMHAYDLMNLIIEEYEEEVYRPLESEIYKCLYDLSLNKEIATREVKRTGAIQKVILYSLNGKMHQAYMKTAEEELERSRRMIDRALKKRKG